MGGNVSREISINEDEEGGPGLGLPRSATLPPGLKGLGERLSWPGSLPRGLGLDSSFSVKLTKSKKLDGTPSKAELDETKVEIVKKEKPDEEEEEETMKDYIEAMLVLVLEDALAKVGDKKMKKSSTLPAGFRGLTKSHSFGKRIRQSIRVLVPSRKTMDDVTEEKAETETDEKADDTAAADVDVPNPPEVDESCVSAAEAESTLNTTKNRTLPLSLKNFDLQSKKKQIQTSLKKLVNRTKKPKKETLALVNSIVDDILKEVEGEQEHEIVDDKEVETEKEDKGSDDEESNEEAAKEKISLPDEKADNETEEIVTGVLDKSND